ncbi:MAG: PadR family transcriptional regulator [Phycisphaerales bacterium]|nr:PadR family transcriptional regulator [Phycisphaerales bacterium]
MAKKEKTANQREAVLLQILVNGEKYGLEIRDEYKKRTGRDLPLGSMYPTLDIMIDKGFVKSRQGESSHERGGNRRRYYQITAPGRRALNAAQLIAAAILGDVRL